MRSARIFLVAAAAAVIGHGPLSVPAASAADKPRPKAKSSHHAVVKARGILHDGVIAIGGETTGTELRIDGGPTLELDLSGNEKLAAQAKKLNGEEVVLSGNLTVRKGVEIPLRVIVAVKSLQRPPQQIGLPNPTR